MRVEGVAGVDQRQRHLALGEVGAERFAGGRFVAFEVEQVVGDLERDAQVAAEGGEAGDRLFVAAGVVGAEPAAAGAQLGGLGLDDREVLVLGEVEVAAGDRLAQLAFADDVGRLADRAAGEGGVERAGQVEGVREQEVAQQDAGFVVPAGVDRVRCRRMAASSSTSSWTSVAVWIISTTAASVRCSSRNRPTAWPARSSRAGRSRLPPRRMPWRMTSSAWAWSLWSSSASRASTRPARCDGRVERGEGLLQVGGWLADGAHGNPFEGRGTDATACRARRLTVCSRSRCVAEPMSAAAARFFFQLNAFDRHAAVDRLAHIVNGEGRDGDRRQGFHFDARFGLDRDRAVDDQRFGRPGM